MPRTLFLLTVLALAGCAAPSGDAPAEAPRMVGADADAHGCRPSAGYRWCARTAQCERPWELAEAAGFESSEAGFTRYCGTD